MFSAGGMRKAPTNRDTSNLPPTRETLRICSTGEATLPLVVSASSSRSLGKDPAMMKINLNVKMGEGKGPDAGPLHLLFSRISLFVLLIWLFTSTHTAAQTATAGRADSPSTS